MNFKSDGYAVVKNAISKEVAEYIKINFDVYENSMLAITPITETNPYPFGDLQSPISFAAYSPLYGESLLIYLKPMIESVAGIGLTETYSYMRIYYKGASLDKHIDRESCEVSATLCIKKDSDWPIYFQKKTGEQVGIELEEGDLVVYRGNDLLHWRNVYTGNKHYQMFLHFVETDGKFGKEFKWDRRPAL